MSPIIQEQHLARGRRWKRRRDRRVFVERIEAHDREWVTIRPVGGGAERVVSRFMLVRDFTEVARCPRCNWHIDVGVAHFHDVSFGQEAA